MNEKATKIPTERIEQAIFLIRSKKVMLDNDYDGRSLFPKQVFFPYVGENNWN